MPLPSAPPCEHELRPGTAVCLRCQHAERAAKRSRQRKLLARGGAATLAATVLAVIGIAAAATIKTHMGAASVKGESPTRVATAGTTSDSGTPSAIVASGDPLAEPAGDPSVDSTAQPKPVTQSLVARASGPPGGVGITGTAALAPIIPPGRTQLRDTIVAIRSGDTVRVTFDLMLERTRRPEKFESIVRRTLPQVYGSAADSALRALPIGAVARAGDLLADLPERGLRIRLAGGRSLALWPETRPGRDGPIVVAYRAVPSR